MIGNSGNIKKLYYFLMHIIFPPKCIFCGKILGANTRIELCPCCEKSMHYISGALCSSCGKPLEDISENPQCTDCSRNFRWVTQGTSVCYYKGNMQRAIKKFKYYGKKSYARTLGYMISKRIRDMDQWPEFDMVVYTPLTAKRMRKRGYNQAALLAAAVATHQNYRLGKDVLKKTRETSSQSSLTRVQRKQNIVGTVEVKHKSEIQGKKLLLVDDVYTTGATVNECAKMLKKAGAKEVYVVTAAIGKGK